jgi:two-component system, OmpR family, copper resistance phosphate regulon response regulator CusR
MIGLPTQNVNAAPPVPPPVPMAHPQAIQVLVADDDVPLARFLQRGLQTEKCAVTIVHDGEAANAAAANTKYDLLILDLNLPKLDGISLLRKIRPANPHLPILVLTARSGLEDRVMVLDSGADDCLIKPFSFQELAARIRALLRRTSQASIGTISVSDLLLNRDELRVERAGKRIDLTAKEYALLEFLMLNARRPVTRAMIMEKVWKAPYDDTSNLVDVYVKYVRDKVDAEASTKLVRTVRGVGYVLSDN